MAVDTRDKRSSCVGFAHPSRAVLPSPEGTARDQADRQHLCWTYRGIEAQFAFTGQPDRAEFTARFDYRIGLTAAFTHRISRTREEAED